MMPPAAEPCPQASDRFGRQMAIIVRQTRSEMLKVACSMDLQCAGRWVTVHGDGVNRRQGNMATEDRSDLAAALLMERLVREAYSDRGPGSVTPLQWAILRTIGRVAPGPCPQSWIARYVGVTAAPVSRAIRALERHGAVATGRDPDDGRQINVELTRTGREMLREDPILAIAARIRHMDPDQKVAFRSALQHLFVAPEQHGPALGEYSDR